MPQTCNVQGLTPFTQWDFPGTINQGITSGDITYNQEARRIRQKDLPKKDGEVLQLYYDPSTAKCSELAYLLQYLLLSIGADGGDVRYFFGGTSSSVADLYGSNKILLEYYSLTVLRGGVRVKNRYHTMTLISGAYYDPSYGVIGDIGHDFSDFWRPHWWLPFGGASLQNVNEEQFQKVKPEYPDETH
jgi:hypothetical protein